jgi:serine protease Do
MPAVRTTVLAAFLGLALSPLGVAHAAGPIPPLPSGGGNAPAAAPAAGAAQPGAGGADIGAASVIERVRRGIVMIERDGHLLGFGTVLGGDGRIVTALSSLGASDAADVRYADGNVVHARVGHRDKSWDLALLIPQSGKWKDGLQASEADPASVELRAPIPLKIGARPIALPVHFKGRTDALSREGEALLNALDVELHNTLPIAGAPIVDGAGTVVGVIVRACRVAMLDASKASSPQIACAPTLIGAPVSALRSFLIHTPTNATAPAPWLGIVGQPDASGSVHGVRVMAVAPQSPAAKGGLKSNADRERSDLIIAVDGAPVDSPEKLADAIAKHAIGDTVKLLVFGVPSAAPPGKGDAKSDAKAGASGASEKKEALEANDSVPPSFHEVAVQLRGAP